MLVIRMVKLLYNSFIWGLLAAVMAFQNTWLEMRMNIGYIIPLLMTVMVVSSYISAAARRNHRLIDRMGFKFAMMNLLLCSIAALVILGFERFAVVPAAIVREGLKASGISFAAINTVIIVIFLMGAAFLALNERTRKTS